MNNNFNNNEIDKPALKNKVSAALKNAFIEAKDMQNRNNKEGVTEIKDSIKEFKEELEEDHKALLKSRFLFRVTLITFDGALIALIVNSFESINYNPLGFGLLFLSIVLFILEFSISFLRNEYDFSDSDLVINKIEEVVDFCERKHYNSETINDLKYFMKTLTVTKISASYEKLRDSKDIAELSKNFDKKYNIFKAFWVKFIWELIVISAFLSGVGITLYDILMFLLNR